MNTRQGARSGVREGRASVAPIRLLETLGVAGRRGRTVASALDLLRSTGPGYAWRRAQAGRNLPALGLDARNAVYRRIWTEAAAELGARLTDVSHGFYDVSRAERSTRIWQQVVALDDPVTLRLALDKPLVHRLLSSAALPVPEHVEFDFADLRAPLAFMHAGAGACVVKPARGTGGGEGTTAGVLRRGDLMRARLNASRFDPKLLIERQAAGPVYRLLLLDGVLLDVVCNRPPHVVGDGRATIEELVALENERRREARGEAGLYLLTIDLDAVLTLERAGHTLRFVPPAGAAVRVKTVSNENRLQDRETFRGEVAPELIEDARRAASAVGLRLAGVDVITTDPAQPLRRTGGVIAEVNGTPGLHHHYLVADRARATRVAVPILDALLA